jgi:cytidyltransferase-like protein
MIVYTGGTFDLFHAGHAFLLSQCRKLAGPDGKVVIALNTDQFTASYKGRPPIGCYSEREAVLPAGTSMRLCATPTAKTASPPSRRCGPI